VAQEFYLQQFYNYTFSAVLVEGGTNYVHQIWLFIETVYKTDTRVSNWIIFSALHS